MFLATLFLMEGPPKPAEQKDIGHDNTVFTDETGLPSFVEAINGKNAPKLTAEISRL